MASFVEIKRNFLISSLRQMTRLISNRQAINPSDAATPLTFFRVIYFFREARFEYIKRVLTPEFGCYGYYLRPLPDFYRAKVLHGRDRKYRMSVFIVQGGPNSRSGWCNNKVCDSLYFR